MGNALAVSSSGDAVVVGTFSGNGTFGSVNLTALGSSDAFVAKVSSAGTVLWAFRFGGTSADTGTNVAIDPAGDVYAAGTFRNNVTVGNTTLVSQGLTDTFLIKVSGASGAPLWSTSFGSTGSDEPGPGAMSFGAPDSVFLAGAFNSPIIQIGGRNYTNAGYPSSPDWDGYVTNFNASSGAGIWATTFGDHGKEYVNGIAPSSGQRAAGGWLVGWEEQGSGGACACTAWHCTPPLPRCAPATPQTACL